MGAFFTDHRVADEALKSGGQEGLEGGNSIPLSFQTGIKKPSNTFFEKLYAATIASPALRCVHPRVQFCRLRHTGFGSKEPG